MISRLPPPPLLARHALFLDVDGTLLGFSIDPATTRAARAQVDALSRVEALVGGAMALVSGRALDALDRIFAPMAPRMACGLHGLELRVAGALHGHRGSPPSRQFLRVAAEAKRLFGDCPGVVVEDKGQSLALHWRGRPAASDRLLAFAWDACTSLGGYHLQSGHEVIEIRPAGADKGAAVSTFMRHPPFVGRTPVFIGDDLTDEPGFAVVNALGGVSILVGARDSSVASHVLPAPADVWAWLEAAR